MYDMKSTKAVTLNETYCIKLLICDLLCGVNIMVSRVYC